MYVARWSRDNCRCIYSWHLPIHLLYEPRPSPVIHRPGTTVAYRHDDDAVAQRLEISLSYARSTSINGVNTHVRRTPTGNAADSEREAEDTEIDNAPACLRASRISRHAKSCRIDNCSANVLFAAADSLRRPACSFLLRYCRRADILRCNEVTTSLRY